MEIKKILVPYDSSQFSDKSFAYAVELAKTIFLGNENTQTIEIILLHIIQELPISKSLFDKPVRNQDGNVLSLSQHAMIIYTEMRENIGRSLEKKRRCIKRLTESE